LSLTLAEPRARHTSTKHVVRRIASMVGVLATIQPIGGGRVTVKLTSAPDTPTTRALSLFVVPSRRDPRAVEVIDDRQTAPRHAIHSHSEEYRAWASEHETDAAAIEVASEAGVRELKISRGGGRALQQIGKRRRRRAPRETAPKPEPSSHFRSSRYPSRRVQGDRAGPPPPHELTAHERWRWVSEVAA
jgi:hypothetical protein